MLDRHGLARFGFRAPAQLTLAYRRARETEHRERRERDRHAIAPHELAGAIPDRVCARAHGLVLQIVRHILRERRDSGIALRRILLQSLRDNVLEIAAECAAQSLWRGGARRRQPACLCIRHTGALRDRTRERRAVRIQNCHDVLRRRARVLTRRMPPGEQLVQHDAERVHVGGHGDRLAANLLGRGVTIGERTLAGPGHSARSVTALIEQLRDAEVEQLHRAVVGHEDVVGLEIAVHDEVRVRVRDGREHLAEETQSRIDGERVLVAPHIDALPRDELEHEIRKPGGADAGIEKSRDVGMTQSRERASFAPKACFAGGARHREAQELDRGVALESSVAPVREPHGAHAAFANDPLEYVRAELLTRQAEGGG